MGSFVPVWPPELAEALPIPSLAPLTALPAEPVAAAFRTDLALVGQIRGRASARP